MCLFACVCPVTRIVQFFSVFLQATKCIKVYVVMCDVILAVKLKHTPIFLSGAAPVCTVANS